MGPIKRPLGPMGSYGVLYRPYPYVQFSTEGEVHEGQAQWDIISPEFSRSLLGEFWGAIIYIYIYILYRHGTVLVGEIFSTKGFFETSPSLLRPLGQVSPF
jgi:hypothetical protein